LTARRWRGLWRGRATSRHRAQLHDPPVARPAGARAATCHVVVATTADAAEGFEVKRARRERRAPGGTVLAHQPGMPSILIVDDCSPVALIMARHVRESGFQAFIARDGAEALKMLAQKPIDCILLDLMMPTMTGMELLRQLKQDPRTTDIPVVLVSASVGAFRSHMFAEREADICVGKPFTRAQILQAVREALKRRSVVRTAPAAPVA
jgi:CheY-like chemotaxis protein